MDDTETKRLELLPSRQFPAWLAEHRISLAFTTYQAGKLFLIGLRPDGRLSVFERSFARCMGLWSDGQVMWMSSLYQLWRLENALEPGQTHDGYDRLYMPRLAYVTGDLDIHDVAVDAAGRPLFINTMFSCIAAPSKTASFSPVWKPPFISRLAAEDRCHLNGLAMKDGKPRYVTAVAASDLADGWRDRRAASGIVIDTVSGSVVAEGLCMPHSPRLRGEELWLLNSGTGEIGTIDIDRGTFQPVAFCPGYLRGLTFVGHHAVVGLSRSRHNRSFGGLPLGERLNRHQTEDRCGLMVIDTRTGDIVHWLRIEGVVEELYDVVVLPDCHRPMAIGLQSDEIRRTITIGPEESREDDRTSP